MPALTYPATLPSLITAPVTPAERRLLSDVIGGPQQARGVQRDYLATRQVEWGPFTRAQAEEFERWWRETLVYGGAWFSATWVSPQGRVPLVYQFAEPPKWVYVADGIWRVSAALHVRGRGLVPTDCLIDTFVGGIGQYSLLSGSLAPFSTLSAPSALRTTATSFADNVSRISRQIPERLLSTVSLRFRLRSIGSDDACLAAIYDGATMRMALNPMRETFYDGDKAPHVYVGANDYKIGGSGLSLGVTYDMTLTIPPTGNTMCVVTDLDAGVVVASQSLGVQTQPHVDSLVFYVDEARPGKLCETDYYYVRVC